MNDDTDPMVPGAASCLELRVSPSRSQRGYRELGITPLALQLGLEEWQLNGHWCSRCQGIWFGYTLEAQCPQCGNRHG